MFFFVMCDSDGSSEDGTGPGDGGPDTGADAGTDPVAPTDAPPLDPNACASPVTDMGEVSLKDVFAPYFEVGVALKDEIFYNQDPDSVALVTRHFNRISPENALKWESSEPQEGVFSSNKVTSYVEFGEKRGMSVYGHVLLWHWQTPDWVFQDESGAEVDRETLLARFEAHVAEFATRFGGRIAYWDVVNEAFNDDGTLKDTNWLQIIGDDYIEQAFRIADRLLPDSKLLYNDYSMFQPGRRSAVLQLVADLRAAGVRIDAVGMQGHYKMYGPSVNQLQETFAAFRNAGIEVFITELDLDVLPMDVEYWGADLGALHESDLANIDPYRECLPNSMDIEAAERWAEIFRVFIDNSDIINGVTFWGVHDGLSWLNDYPLEGRTNYSLLFGRDYQPKTAFKRIVQVAQGQ